MHKPSLIVGIDPGATLSYVALDLAGKPLLVRSSKTVRFNEMLRELTDLGTILIVGTDKKSAPSLAERLAIKSGARLITPPEDLKVDEKRDLAARVATANNHELDAAAAARFAFHSTEQLINKILSRSEDIDIEQREALLRLVIRDGFSISEGLDWLAEEPEPESDEPREESRANAYQRRIHALRLENSQLRARIKDLNIKARDMEERIKKMMRSSGRRNTRDDARRENRERELRNEIEAMLRANVQGTSIICAFHDEGSFIMRRNPLRLNHDISLITRDKNKKMAIVIRSNGPETRVDASGIVMKQTKNLALIDLESLHKALKRTHIIETIIEEYRTEKHHERPII